MSQLKAIAIELTALIFRQDAPTLAMAGILFILLSNFIAPILNFLAGIMPPLLLGWGLFHALVAGFKFGAGLFWGKKA